jgi:hypothetical protein
VNRSHVTANDQDRFLNFDRGLQQTGHLAKQGKATSAIFERLRLAGNHIERGLALRDVLNDAGETVELSALIANRYTTAPDPANRAILRMYDTTFDVERYLVPWGAMVCSTRSRSST